MAWKVEPLFAGMLHDAATRIATDVAASSATARAGTGMRAGAGTAPTAPIDPIASMGLAGVLVPQAFGGMGASVTELGAVVDAFAARALPLSVIERCVVAPLLLIDVDAPDRALGPACAGWLRAIAAGDARIAPLLPARGMPAAPGVVAARNAGGGGFTLDGCVEGVDLVETPGAEPTHWLIVADRPDDAASHAVFVVDASALPPPAARYRSVDGRVTGDFVLRATPLGPATYVAGGPALERSIACADDLALALVCVDIVATLGALIEQTIAYLNERVQFGVALSSFQVLRHRLVDMYVRYESAKGIVASGLHGFPAEGMGRHRDPRTLRLAKVSLGETARFAAESAIQLHGGMGMSEELPAARLAQRLLTNEFRCGDRFRHATALLAQPAGALA